MKVSVIITTYNKPQYLKKTIDGYLHQSHKPDEIIIADDGSSGETITLIDKFKRDSKIKIIHVCHEDRGFRASLIRNRAVSSSSGEYLIISDDDVIPDFKFVEDHLNYSEYNRFIQGHRVLLGPQASTNFTFDQISTKNILKLYIKGQVRNILNAFRFPIPLINVSQRLEGIRSCNMSFFKKDLIAINGFNEDFEGWGKEDSELVVRFYKYGLKRKDLKFRAGCYHLDHPLLSREKLEQNIDLLEKAKNENGYYCNNGLDKYIAHS